MARSIRVNAAPSGFSRASPLLQRNKSAASVSTMRSESLLILGADSHIHSCELAPTLAANDLHDCRATRKRYFLFVAQGFHQQALQGRQCLVARLIEQVTDVVAIAR